MVNVKIKDKDFQDNWTKSCEKCEELKIQEGGEAASMSDENEDDDDNEEESRNLGCRLIDTSRTSRNDKFASEEIATTMLERSKIIFRGR